MSAQAGILYRDRRPVDPELVQRMAESIESAGPHGCGTFTGPGVALVHQALHFDDLSALETHPGMLPDGRVLTWDGRLDNRNDLLCQLGHTIQGTPTDLAIVSKAFERWNLDALERLIGDWSLALWDPRSDELVLSRDYMGTRPLLYFQRGDYFVWSTCLKTIKGLFDLGDEINEHYLAGRLTFGPPPYQTLHKGLLHVPAAHFVRVTSRGTVTVTRYHKLPHNTVRYQDPRDYEVHFRELFQQAVETRLRSNRTVWAELSGGYDSSAVVCVAHHLLAQGKGRFPALQPVSRVFPDSPESDESRHIEQIERWTGLLSRKIPIYAKQAPAPDQEDSSASKPTTSITQLMESDMAYVLLSGEFGDLAMAKGSANCAALLEDLARWDLSAFLTGFLQFSRVRKTPWYHTLGRICEPMWSSTYDARGQQRTITRELAMSRGIHARSLADVFGLTDDFVRRTDPMPVTPPLDIAEFPYAKRILAAGTYNFQLMNWLGTREDSMPVRRTYPIAHRPLVDFLLAVPQRVLWDPVRLRSFMRRAFTGVMPAAVLDREDKGYASPIVARMAFSATGPMSEESIRTWELCRRGCLDPLRFYRLLSAPKRNGSIAGSGALGTAWEIESWFRAKRGASSRPLDTVA